MDTLWRIELLGGLRVHGTGRVVTRFRTEKTASLLAYLAYQPHLSHPRDLLIDRLWPDDEPDSARQKLRTALSSLRRQLEPPGVPAGGVIIADRTAVQLNPVAVTTDVAEFEAALHAAARSQSGVERALLLAQAVELYRGELLPGHYEEWIDPERPRLAEAFLQALRGLILHLEESHDLQRALDYAYRAVGADPLREESQRELIRLLVVADQPSAALQQYRELERLLKAELGAAPSVATRRLAELLQVGAAGSERDLPSGEPSRSQPGADDSARDTLVHHPPSTAPVGTVTFLLTDIEASTALWERTGEAFKTALGSHHEMLRREFRRHLGYSSLE